jgi:hypothetical protein
MKNDYTYINSFSLFYSMQNIPKPEKAELVKMLHFF